MTLDKVFYGTVASALIMGVLSLYGWSAIPEGAQIPIHWGIDGQPDNFAGKTFALSVMPLMTLAMAFLLKALPHLEPRKKHLERSPKLVGATWIGLNLVLWSAHITVVGTGLGYDINTLLLLSVSLGLMMMLIGNYAAKSKSMFLVGFRTPWTLSSETVWTKTHRFFGRLFIIGGLIMVIAPLTISAENLITYLLFGTVMLPVLVTLVYSWVVWKQEQQEK